MLANPGTKILRSAPYFCVTDVVEASSFYERMFGFRTEYMGGNQFSIQSRDGFAIMLRAVTEGTKIRPNQNQGGTWDAFFWVDDVESLFQEYKTKGVEVVYEPVIQEHYMMKEFAVKDLNGYVLGFGQDWSQR